MKAWLERFDARPQRERVLMLGAALAVLLLLADSFWLSPAYKEWKAQTAQHQQAAAAAAQLHQALGLRQQQLGEKVQAQVRELQDWQQRLRQAEAALSDRGGQLVHANEMVGVLEAVIRQNAGLKLRSMQNLPRTEVDTGGGALLYRHGVELVVEGSYAELLTYLQALQALPQRLLWGGMGLNAEQHPRLTLTLRLYTLSQDKQWLEL
ncbi:type 4a pilus biogenesis protein PilO [Pelomonas sp. SE-A7]|uniref:type 4a pilus biogenesis protein PilO n=1 Tax=Pelomonas sp. SE-A7 TaxID=3054953 RepID=UPI00259C71BC|nr:type 4a pilus biogenesis protein PilO [Pelomonas sp. SE-A7]MDM4767781.1 type 4a pilus biogenesis protein PilO [Pelomonas sp. SE-A7]